MFVLPKSANVERAIWRVLMKRYRDWRFGLRRDYYLKYKTDKERLSNCPSGVAYNEWKWLVEQYWGTQKFKLRRLPKNKYNFCIMEFFAFLHNATTALQCKYRNILHL